MCTLILGFTYTAYNTISARAGQPILVHRHNFAAVPERDGGSSLYLSSFVRGLAGDITDAIEDEARTVLELLYILTRGHA